MKRTNTNSPLLIGILMTILLSLIGQPARAGLLRLESNTIFSTYRGQDLALESPLIEFFEAHFNDQGKRLNLSTNFSVFADASNQKSEFNVYTLDGSYELVPDKLKLTFGRSFKTFSTIRPSVMDSLEVESYFLEKRLTTGAYAGIERKFEALGKPESRSNVYGGFATYRTSSFFPLTVGGRLAHYDYDTGSTSANLASLSLNQPLSGQWSPELLGSTEWDLDQARSNRAEIGIDLYPTHRSTFGVRYLTYDLSSASGADSSIFSVFAQGRLNETTIRTGYQFVSGVSASVAWSYDQFVVQEGRETNGKKVELGLGYGTDRFQLQSFVYYLSSYGGRALGDKLQLNIKGLGRWEIFSFLDLVTYEKVTSSRRSALSTQVGATTWFQSSFRLDMGGEFNNNNIDIDDFRFFARLTYLLWRET